MTHGTISVRDAFHIDCDWLAPRLAEADEHVPDREDGYFFDTETTSAILAGFIHNQRVLIQGYHGTGKSTHIEQVAARLNWPCVRVSLDGQVSRIDLVGKDGITLKDGKQVTEFQPGIITWALQRPMALILDEYDAARPDVMFVIQRILEHQGKLTLLDQNRVIKPHPQFRLFATANTIGLGDSTGLYHGTQLINQGQLDRWNLIATLNYLSAEDELKLVMGKYPDRDDAGFREQARQMILLADLTRQGFLQGDLSTLMSPRTILSWIDNAQIFGDTEHAFRLTFYNRCDDTERELLAEYYFRCIGRELNGGNA